MGFRIIQADLDDPVHRQAIRRLWDDNLRFVAQGRFEWLYEQNPAGETLTCLAVHEDSGEVIGTASAMRRDFHFQGEPCQAGIAIDFAIDAEHRVFGPALALQRALAEEAWRQGLDFMLGFPNLASQGILKRVGYRQIGASIRFSRLIRSRHKLIALLQHRRLPVGLAHLVSPVVDTGLLLQQVLAQPLGQGRFLSSLEMLGEQWQEVVPAKAVPLPFQGEYGKSYMSWRYKDCPYRDYRFYGVFDGQKLMAFLVFSIRDQIVLVDDFRFLDEAWVRPLFRHFWREMRNAGESVINVGLIVNGELENLMGAAGFISRPSRRWGGILSNPEKQRDWVALLSQKDWFITDGEIDL